MKVSNGLRALAFVSGGLATSTNSSTSEIAALLANGDGEQTSSHLRDIDNTDLSHCTSRPRHHGRGLSEGCRFRFGPHQRSKSLHHHRHRHLRLQGDMDSLHLSRRRLRNKQAVLRLGLLRSGGAGHDVGPAPYSRAVPGDRARVLPDGLQPRRRTRSQPSRASASRRAQRRGFLLRCVSERDSNGPSRDGDELVSTKFPFYGSPPTMSWNVAEQISLKSAGD